MGHRFISSSVNIKTVSPPYNIIRYWFLKLLLGHLFRLYSVFRPKNTSLWWLLIGQFCFSWGYSISAIPFFGTFGCNIRLVISDRRVVRVSDIAYILWKPILFAIVYLFSYYINFMFCTFNVFVELIYSYTFYSIEFSIKQYFNKKVSVDKYNRIQ